jgi:26S proteasome regulatory subunit N1
MLCRSIQKQLAFMLGRQQICLELDEGVQDSEDLAEIMANAHLNNHFLNLAREVSVIDPPDPPCHTY